MPTSIIQYHRLIIINIPVLLTPQFLHEFVVLLTPQFLHDKVKLIITSFNLMD